MSIASVDGIDAMVAPAVLITLGSLLANGILVASTAVLGNLRSLAGERDELLHPASISAKDRKRLDEIDQQLPRTVRHSCLLRNALVLVYAGIGVLILSVIFIAVAVTAGLQAFGTLALAFVLAGTVGEFAGIVTAGWSVATADPTAYVAERHRTRGLGRSRPSAMSSPFSLAEWPARMRPAGSRRSATGARTSPSRSSRTSSGPRSRSTPSWPNRSGGS